MRRTPEGRRGRSLGRALAAAMLLAIVAPAPALVSATPACADTAAHAALVIDTGAQELTYCVALPGTVDGIELIRLAARQHGLSYALGFGGDAVCSLAGVGVAGGGDCFADFPRFWGYWVGSPSGSWRWSSVGAGSVSVGPGDLQGWSWGTGQDGTTHPTPPVTPFDTVCEPDPSDGNGGDGGSGGHAGDDGANGGAGNAGSPTPATGEGAERGGTDDAGGDRDPDGNGPGRDDGRGEPDRDRPDRAEEPAADPASDLGTGEATPLAAAPEPGGGPAGPIVSLVALALLVAGGALMTWKRRAD